MKKSIGFIVVFLILHNNLFSAALTRPGTRYLAPATSRAVSISVFTNPVIRSPLSQRNFSGLASQQSEKPLATEGPRSPLSTSTYARPMSTGTIASRMAMLNMSRNNAMQPGRSFSHSQIDIQDYSPLYPNRPDLSLSKSLHITQPMLDRALKGTDIDPADVIILESTDKHEGLVHMTDDQIIIEDGVLFHKPNILSGERPTGLDRRNVKYIVIHPQIINADGTLNLEALVIAAHEFMHVKNKDSIRREEKYKKIRILYDNLAIEYNKPTFEESNEDKARLGEEMHNLGKEYESFIQDYEKKADTDSALLYPEFNVAAHSISYFRNCLNAAMLRPHVFRRNDVMKTHPEHYERIDYLTPIAEKQTQDRAKKYIEKSTNEFKAHRLRRIIPQENPPSAIELIQKKYMPEYKPTIYDLFPNNKAKR